jgi:pimeloyl-ACP methyl ester carboxylesterase
LVERLFGGTIGAMTTVPSPQRFECVSAGVRLVGEQRGTPERGVVVLLHGGGQTRRSWRRTAERIAAGSWAAVTYDARGHGDSDWDAGQNYTLDAFVADLLTVVRTQQQSIVFIGASLGGITSLVAAAENPGLARGLVLVDVVVGLDRGGTARIVDFLTAHRDGFASLEEVADAIAAYNPDRPRPRNLDGLHKNVRLRADGRWYWHWDPAFIKIGDEPQRQADPHRLRAAATSVQIPTLLVRGAHSDVVSDAGLADMKRLIPTSESIVVPHAGHMIAGDDNGPFVVGLERFLDALQ